MDRITKRNAHFEAYIPDQELRLRGTMKAAVERLADYEDTGLHPGQVAELCKHLDTAILMWFEKTYGIGAGRMMELARADKERRSGRWIEGAENFYSGMNAECSLCHAYINWQGTDLDFNYCPNCGAKMDGGADHAAD